MDMVALNAITAKYGGYNWTAEQKKRLNSELQLREQAFNDTSNSAGSEWTDSYIRKINDQSLVADVKQLLADAEALVGTSLSGAEYTRIREAADERMAGIEAGNAV